MKLTSLSMRKQKGSFQGFTLIEALVAMVVLGLLAAIAIPAYSRWVPDYKLKRAAQELYANLQMAKIGAVKENSDWAVVFDANNNAYYVCLNAGSDNDWATFSDNTKKKIVKLADYGDTLTFGSGNATDDMDKSGHPPSDSITYPNDVVIFTPKGLCDAGVVYLQNSKKSSYAIETRNTGVIFLRKWNPSSSSWE